MRKITKIEPKKAALPERKRVAAYARVSMETERLNHSLSAQVSYYSGLIQKNPAWEYTGCSQTTAFPAPARRNAVALTP